MGSFRCTLCCGETFQTPLQLAAHLENILGNIQCACCGLKFSSLHHLLDHYKSFTVLEELNVDEVQIEWNMDMEAVPEEQIEAKEEVEVASTYTEVDWQMEPQAYEPTVTNNSATSPAVDGQIIIEDGCAEDLSINEGGFHCTCGMYFKSLIDHLMSYHLGEEVIINGDQQQIETFLESVSVGNLQGHSNSICPDNVQDSQVIHVQTRTEGSCHEHENAVVETEEQQMPAQLNPSEIDQLDGKVEECANQGLQSHGNSVCPNTIQDRKFVCEEAETEVIICHRNENAEVERENPPITARLTPSEIDQLDGKVEECVDKDGRLYLRKFVRVKKFWDDKDEANASQMKTKVRNYDTIRDIQVGRVSIKSKDETVTTRQLGQPKRLYQCSECQKTFQTMIHFKYHVCGVKSGSGMTCNLCGHESISTKDLRAHWRMHQRQRRVAATALWELQAGEGVSSNGNDGGGQDTTELQCDRCGEMYRKSEEVVHLAMHNENPAHKCPKCKESFDSKEKLSRHIKSHKEPKTYSCEYCDKTFTDFNAYKLHVRVHTGEKPYECQYCAKSFSRPYERMKHERIHTGERPHICEICGKTFRVSYCLTLHKRTHSGDRPYTCETCGKRFKAHSAYKHHIQIHSDARNYKCPFCPKAFKTMVHLSGHKKTHTKPFLCSECNRRFASLYSMKSHMESHKTGKNSLRYRCFVCGASYARSFALHAHLLTHEPSDAPEDVAEVLEIRGEDQKKEESDVGLVGECSKTLNLNIEASHRSS